MDAGEHAWLLPTVPMKVKLVDYTTAMLPLTAAGTAGRLLIRGPVIIARAARVLREAVGARHPAGTLARRRPGDPGPAQVLELMAEGISSGGRAGRLTR